MNQTGNKFIKLVVVDILVYYIVGLLLIPLNGFFQSTIINNNQIMYLIVKLVISLIVLVISLFIVKNFITLLPGESKKIAIAFAILDFAFGIYSMISNSILTSNLNKLSGQNIQTVPLYLTFLYEIVGSVLVYILTKTIFAKYETIKSI